MQTDIKIFTELLRLKNFIKQTSPVYNAVIRHTTSGYFNLDFWWKDLKEKSFKVETLEDIQKVKDYSFKRVGESY